MVTRVSIKSIAVWAVAAFVVAVLAWVWAVAIVPSTVATQFDAPVAEALYNLLPSSVSYHKSPTVIAVGAEVCLNVLVNPWSSGFVKVIEPAIVNVSSLLSQTNLSPKLKSPAVASLLPET